MGLVLVEEVEVGEILVPEIFLEEDREMGLLDLVQEVEIIVILEQEEQEMISAQV